MDDELMNTLRYLRLRGLLAHWDEYLTLAQKQDFSPVRLLRYVVEEECKTRQEHGRQLRLVRARIPELWRMETFPFARQPKPDKARTLLYARSMAAKRIRSGRCVARAIRRTDAIAFSA